MDTTLDVLLTYLGARTLVLTGVAGNICVLFTANDAYMRDRRTSRSRRSRGDGVTSAFKSVRMILSACRFSRRVSEATQSAGTTR
jgi:nicotinamidase-related amidase